MTYRAIMTIEQGDTFQGLREGSKPVTTDTRQPQHGCTFHAAISQHKSSAFAKCSQSHVVIVTFLLPLTG